jgi:CspA family cold shock protein
MPVVGTVKAWMEDRGFGFITEDGGGDVFAHVKSLPSGVKQLAPKTRVSFEKKHTERGVQAVNIVLGESAEGDGPELPCDLLSEAEYLTELRVIQPPLREVHKQALLDSAKEHGWVD